MPAEASVPTDAVPLRNLINNARPQRRSQIVALKESGFNTREVMAKTLCSRSAVQKTMKRYRERGNLEDAPRSGRPCEHSKRDDRAIALSVITGKADTAVEACRQYNATAEKDKQLGITTIKRILGDSGHPAHAIPRKS